MGDILWNSLVVFSTNIYNRNAQYIAEKLFHLLYEISVTSNLIKKYCDFFCGFFHLQLMTGWAFSTKHLIFEWLFCNLFWPLFLLSPFQPSSSLHVSLSHRHTLSAISMKVLAHFNSTYLESILTTCKLQPVWSSQSACLEHQKYKKYTAKKKINDREGVSLQHF